MYKVFNFIEDKAINIPLTENRGFLYGDGFFETIIIKNGTLQFFDDHYDRMSYAALQLNLIPFPSKEQLKNQLQTFFPHRNKLIRLKIIVFRNSDGLFAPNQNTPLFYFEEKEINKKDPIHKSAFFSTTITNRASLTSKFKTLSSLNYILAGIELNKKSKDEIILLDDKKNISECLTSTIWWIKNDCIYTPSELTGCIEGIAKKNIIRFLSKKRIKIEQGEYQKEALLTADFCFTSNVAGLHIIQSIEMSQFQNSNVIFENIKKALF
jgi:4-amino-4-deoxychorismate lyase